MNSPTRNSSAKLFNSKQKARVPAQSPETKCLFYQPPTLRVFTYLFFCYQHVQGSVAHVSKENNLSIWPSGWKKKKNHRDSDPSPCVFQNGFPRWPVSRIRRIRHFGHWNRGFSLWSRISQVAATNSDCFPSRNMGEAGVLHELFSPYPEALSVLVCEPQTEPHQKTCIIYALCSLLFTCIAK